MVYRIGHQDFTEGGEAKPLGTPQLARFLTKITPSAYEVSFRIEPLNSNPVAVLQSCQEPRSILDNVSDQSEPAWVCSRFAECLLPLIDQDMHTAVETAKGRLEQFIGAYREHWLSGMRVKLGLDTKRDGDGALIESLFDLMAGDGADFTLTFYQLSRVDMDASKDDAVLALFENTEPVARWLDRWRQRLRRGFCPSTRSINSSSIISERPQMRRLPKK